jgi:hypothetical protein
MGDSGVGACEKEEGDIEIEGVGEGVVVGNCVMMGDVT